MIWVKLTENMYVYEFVVSDWLVSQDILYSTGVRDLIKAFSAKSDQVPSKQANL